MSLKNLFKKGYTKNSLAVRIEDTLSEVESRQYIAARNYEKTEFEPHVDFTTASNFARYGSAKKYYEDAFTWIYTSYPYDGSALEKTEWYNSSSYIDRHIFEKEYPRTTGYVTLGSNYGPIIEQFGGGLDPLYSACDSQLRVHTGQRWAQPCLRPRRAQNGSPWQCI